MLIEIKNRWTEKVIVSGEAETLRAFLEAQIKSRATLDGATLTRANLTRANLYGAKLNDERTAKAVLQMGPLGSRRSQLIVWLCDDASILVDTGCFYRRSLDEFQDAITETHGENVFGREYRAAVQFILAWAALKTERRTVLT